MKPLKTSNGVMFIRSLYLSPLEDVIDMVQFYERTTPQGGSYIVAKAGFLTAAVIMPYVISKKFADELEELSYQCRHFLNTRSAFTTPAAEDEEEPDENQTTTFDAAATDKSAKCPAYYTTETDGLKSPWNLAGGTCILQPSIRARGWEMGSQSLRGSPARRNRRSSDSGPD